MSTDAELASEAALHDFQSRIAQLEALHEADQLEVTALRRSEDEATSQLSSLKGEQAKLEHRLERQEEEARAAQSTRERVEGEKRELLEALARSDADKLQLDGQGMVDTLIRWIMLTIMHPQSPMHHSGQPSLQASPRCEPSKEPIQHSSKQTGQTSCACKRYRER